MRRPFQPSHSIIVSDSICLDVRSTTASTGEESRGSSPTAPHIRSLPALRTVMAESRGHQRPAALRCVSRGESGTVRPCPIAHTCPPMPGAALCGTVHSPVPIHSCRALSGPSGTAWHCSALSDPTWSCLAQFGPVWPCPTLSGAALFHPARPCPALPAGEARLACAVLLLSAAVGTRRQEQLQTVDCRGSWQFSVWGSALGSVYSVQSPSVASVSCLAPLNPPPP